ncbi:MAG: hypothetical protein M3450_20860 [Actinomycetota bacterium]|nr:hypothetical protein [Actinomycetota bacterium]
MRRAGAALALLYVVVALATNHLSTRPVLPLFDGFAPPTPYQWVEPPPERAGDNVVPQPVEREFPLTANGAAASNATSDDAQVIVGLAEGSVPASPPDTAVVVRMVPTDAGTLGPLPPGLRAVSNAYKVELRYVPSQTPLTRMAAKGTLALTAAEAGDRLLYSAGGETWEERPFRPYGTDHGLFTELEEVGGWFVVASSARPAAPGREASDVLRVVLLVALGVAPIVGAILVVRLPSPVPAAPTPRRGPPRWRPSSKKRPKRRR